MIGIHIYGEIVWFDFPHTHENQDMLIRRLEREARQCHLNFRLKHMRQNFAIMGQHMEEAAKQACKSLAAFGRVCSGFNLRRGNEMNTEINPQKAEKGYAILFTLADEPEYLVLWGLPLRHKQAPMPKRLAVRPYLFSTVESAEKAFRKRGYVSRLFFFKTVYIDLTTQEGYSE